MIHHITAVSGDAQRTTEFYAKTLGMRLVKVTVNQDDIGTYHLYFADRTGSPGTVLTFFPWKDLPKGRAGPGMASSVELAAPEASLDFWEQRLSDAGVLVRSDERFGERVLVFRDPDGLQLGIVGSGEAGDWALDDVPKEHAISGFYGVTLTLDGYEDTAEVLTDHLGFSFMAQEDQRYRFTSEADTGAVVDLLEKPAAHPGRPGAGTVHHVAFRASDDSEQLKKREAVISAGLNATPVIERYYFKSVYFREPGGVLFEIATDGPGFAVDEPEESLGESLVLPPFLEDRRGLVERSVPPLTLPSGRTVP